jgi:hypothetical protein
MRIGITGTRGIPNHYGGFEQAAEYLSQGLAEKSHEVFVYNSHNHPYREKKWNAVNIIHCYDPEYKLGTAGQFIYDLNCINDARKRNFDVLLHFGYSSDSVWWWRWPKKATNIVNMDGLEWNRTKYNWLTRRFLKKAESMAAKNAQILIADSPGIQEHILTTYKKESVFIPYGAEVFTDSNPSVLATHQLLPNQYFLLIARMEPENNVEMIIQGYLGSKHQYPLFIIGSTDNKFGKYLTGKYNNPGIKFAGSVYDKNLLNNFRFFSSIYFHGHSVGGTNPSLLEAMACRCNIAAHDNIFNKAVLANEADYFSSASDIAAIINKPKELCIVNQNKILNTEKIRTIYNPEKIVSAYEELIVHACR